MLSFLNDSDILAAGLEVTKEIKQEFFKIEFLLKEFIIPNIPKEADIEIFKQACLLQYEYIQSDTYKTIGFKSFSIGNFSGSRGDTVNVSDRICPEVKALLKINGYLYKGLG